ncbi:MAG: hypothetical protein E5V22_21405 [Mesorhizobium sp.]|uniref:hypothetical protein n=1 Tax=Mesorhizobium sp. TaxID=1871066 RepID=UPI000FEA90B8|nr:hypothetical protein [Mesorhizobium sp.]RWD50866.1 MAG: hypothetical protein EOS59_07700 [Mesorhizobium sp.]RWE58571.1 MAG: hypothetical protein EOS24_17580 [Mesorhizobium sp.]RWF09190.1 MAG: hypothetical protein EOS69_20380 [Mesorhizobium sp.]TIY01420.1 MAG: hypothetical protein E5V22_21405 [Mesorhizobium sp.]
MTFIWATKNKHFFVFIIVWLALGGSAFGDCRDEVEEWFNNCLTEAPMEQPAGAAFNLLCQTG